MNMQVRWKWVLPVIGLALFFAQTYLSCRVHRETQRSASRYFWWSSVRLDSEPLNEPSKVAQASCADGSQNCTTWDLPNTWPESGLLAKVQIFSAFPAFIGCALVMVCTSRLGVSQIISFFVFMPASLFVWYYLAGSLLDRSGTQRAPSNTGAQN